MAEATATTLGGVLPFTGGGDFPPLQHPTIYADGVLSLTISANAVVMAYLFRYDPSFKSDGTNSIAVFAQLVMSIQAFIQTTLFMESQLQEFVKRGAIPQATVDQIRATFAKQNPNAVP